MAIKCIDYLQQIPGSVRTVQEDAEFAVMVEECKRLALACKVRVVVSPPIVVVPGFGDRVIGLYHPRQPDDQPLALVMIKRRGDPDPPLDDSKQDGTVWSGLHA